jgi:hypothetical protein
MLFVGRTSVAPKTLNAATALIKIVISMLFAAQLYAIMGFLIGAIGAFVYNLVAKWIGGIEVEVE